MEENNRTYGESRHPETDGRESYTAAGRTGRIPRQQGDPRYAQQYGEQQYAQDPRYAQQYGQAPQQYGEQQYAQDPRYAQQYGQAPQYGEQQYAQDPRYAQQYGQAPQYGEQQYAQDPRYAQQYGQTPQYGEQQYAQDPRYTQQYGASHQYTPSYGGYGTAQAGYPQQRRADTVETQGYTGSYRRPEQSAPRADETSRMRRPRSYDEESYEAEGEPRRRHRRHDAAQDETEHEPRRRRKPRYDDEESYDEETRSEDDSLLSDGEAFASDDEPGDSALVRRIRAIRRAMADVPSRTLLLIGGGITLVLIAVILVVVLIPKEPATPPVVAASETPVITSTPTPTPTPTPTVAPTPHPCATPLNFGMTADIVAEIQQRLIDLGYMNYPVVDGVEQVTTVYGSKTKNAIRTFQIKNNLESDGQCGVSTYDLLMSDQAKGYFISRNDEGEMVAKMQERLIQLGYLKTAATGYCGESTVLAVQKFQQKNGLDADGKAGQQTLKLLYSDQAIAADGTAAGSAASPSTPGGTATPGMTVSTATPAQSTATPNP